LDGKILDDTLHVGHVDTHVSFSHDWGTISFPGDEHKLCSCGFVILVSDSQITISAVVVWQVVDEFIGTSRSLVGENDLLVVFVNSEKPTNELEVNAILLEYSYIQNPYHKRVL
jgi:hypothetical protein